MLSFGSPKFGAARQAFDLFVVRQRRAFILSKNELMLGHMQVVLDLLLHGADPAARRVEDRATARPPKWQLGHYRGLVDALGSDGRECRYSRTLFDITV